MRSTRSLILIIGACVLAFTLAACAPGVTGTATRNPDGSTVTTNFNAGAQDALKVALLITGKNLSVVSASPECTVGKPTAADVSCTPGTVPAGKDYTVTVKGVDVRCNVSYYRPGNLIPQFLFCTPTNPTTTQTVSVRATLELRKRE